MSDAPILPDDEPVSLSSERTMRGGEPNSLGRIDHYELLRKLGGGGFGVVYLARDTVGGVEVALKTLHPLLKRNAEEMDLLREKFKLASRLAHPNIATALVLHRVGAIDVWDDEARRELKLSPGDSVMVMRYAPGVTLSKWRRQFPEGIVSFDRAVEIGRQVAAALDYAHDERIVHRDVKPGNIMVETLEGGRVRARLLDFGLAAEIRSTMARVSNEAGNTSGTRPYMAPEQWMGKKQDGRTDQYALACVLYELLAGAPPFAGVFETGDPIIMRTAVERDKPEGIAEVSDAANAALQRALAKTPAERFPTCAAFVAALAAEGFDMYGPALAPAGEAPATPEKRIEEALAEQARAAREAELAGRREAARRAVDLQALKDLKRAVERRVASLDATWTDGAFAGRRKAIADARAKLAACTDAASLATAKELRGDIYDAVDWLERNTPARTGLKAQEDALDALAGDCAKADAASLAAVSWNRAERARADAAARRDEGLYEEAASGYGAAKTFYEKARDEAGAVKASAEVESARIYEQSKMWADCLAAAQKALEWEPGNKEAAALKTEAEKNLAKPGERKLVSVGGVEVALRRCPPGTFTMGSLNGANDEKPQIQVTIREGFWMGETEVTQDLWQEVIGWDPSYYNMGGTYPVENVSWNDCKAFIEKLNARSDVRSAGLRFAMPTEAQWEYACRAGTTGDYGGTGRLDDMGWYASNSGDTTHPVGQKKENAWGLRDMHGNVWEWCANVYRNRSDGTLDNAAAMRASGDDRVLRGGSYWCGARICRSANRGRNNPGYRIRSNGFRLCAFQDGK